MVSRASPVAPLWVCAVLLLFSTCPLRADVFNPAYLQLGEQGEGIWDVAWMVPATDAVGEALQVQLPDELAPIEPRRRQLLDGYVLERWRVQSSGAIAGTAVSFAGLRGGVTDVIARVQYANGAEQVERLSPDAAAFIVKPPAGTLDVAGTYFVLGVEHILLGLDHLLFVLALLLIVKGWRQIAATVTAFTVAHSITLVAASLGWLSVPIAPVEAIIALSIVFVAAEAVHGMQGRPGLTARMPWVVAFTFGLLHGLGFASALSEIGLPAHAVPLALFTFNIGVEAGQLLFVVLMLSVATGLRRSAPNVPWSASLGALAYIIGALAAYWSIERVAYGVLGI